ncbi:MAG: thiamine phosphate synthase [Epsilonproteobacteria bacterium]|nr:thiamine phosphate synthase [Campylobacterota bacterium]
MIAYAITDSSTLNFQTLQQDLQRFKTKANMIVYRDKVSLDYAFNAKAFVSAAKAYGFDKVLLHSDVLLAKRLKADGVHLSSQQFNEIDKAKALGLFIVISTHSKEEIEKAEHLGADMVTYSPIFHTPNKGEPKGLDRLKEVTSSFTVPIIALGGILTVEQIDKCKESGAKGFASIRYFL